ANMIFITAGMGGGTGTGGAPVIAQAAREVGILTVGVVTKPFQFEGARRMRAAEAGIEELAQHADTLIIIPNQNLFRVANEKTTFAEAFKLADEVLHSGVRGVTDLMVMPGLINLDFADIQSVMTEMGKAIMGTGEAEGEERALTAAEAAISNPLLDEISMKGARGVLINITGGMDLTLYEVDQAANRIRDEVDPEANIIFGSTFDQRLEGRMRVSVVATGIDAERSERPRSVPLSLVVSRATGDKSDGRTAPRTAVPPRAQPETPEPETPEPAVNAEQEPGDGREGSQAPTAAETGAEAPAGATMRGGEPPESSASGAAEPQRLPFEEPAPEPEPAGADIAEPEPQEPEEAQAVSAEARETAANFAPEPAPTVASDAQDEELEEAPARSERKRSTGIFSWIAGGGGVSAEEHFEKGDRHYYGQGVRKNHALALRSYRKAAEMGHAAAQNRLGWMYEKGEGVESDYVEAVKWYRRAAEQGHVNAMNDLGYMYRQGWGVPQSHSEALKWFRRAAEKYDSYAEYNMGQMFENGWGVERDIDEAIRWFRRSAARGHEWAAKRLEELGVTT
ncbi:MAG TPA: hypothetical protein VLL72_05280, partial [Kiloniellales bacterium]|nr:hypothetical protein [Kiloniellales bacterium]